MKGSLFLMLFLGHVLADYYFQNETLANGKRGSFLHLMVHSLIHLLTYSILLVPFWQLGYFYIGVGAAFSHFVIDFIKFLLTKAIDGNGHGAVVRALRKLEDQGWLYSIDQMLHLVILLLMGYWGAFVYGGSANWLMPRLGTIAMPLQGVKYLVALLLILKPANITFRVLFKQNKPTEEMTFVKDMKAGQRIGNMERMLMIALLSLGQYTAIGLVFTAKSVTRYNRIAKEQAFAEYYLLGTLYSILVVIAVHIGLMMI